MIKNLTLVLIFVVAVVVVANSLKAQNPSHSVETPNGLSVIELFTSQSCSSCPPADRLLGDISGDPNLITLGFHVTYWNHLHWKDTLSREFATARQRSYAGYKKTGRVYTPQMIVSGGAEFTGSNRSKLQRALKNVHPVQRIATTRNGDTLTLDLPDIKGGAYTLWVYGVQNGHTQGIKSGENRGRSVTYTNSVITQDTAGSWDGDAKTLSIDLPDDTAIDGVVVIAQANGFGPIGAAGRVDL